MDNIIIVKNMVAVIKKYTGAVNMFKRIRPPGVVYSLSPNTLINNAPKTGVTVKPP
jgi:hypothetical protein